MNSDKITSAALLLVVAIIVVLLSVTSATNISHPSTDQPAFVNNDDNTRTATNKLHTGTPQSNILKNGNVRSVQPESTTGKNADPYQVYNKACEAGYPCSKDQWCSSQKRCRSCSDLERWCNQTFVIHQNYTTCEDFCYRFQIKKTTQCEAAKESADRRIEHLTQSLREVEMNLNTTKKQADEERTASSMEEAQLKQQLQGLNESLAKKQDEVDELKGDLARERENAERCTEQKESAKDYARALEIGIALCVVIAVVAVGLAIMLGPQVHRLIARLLGANETVAGPADEAPSSSTSLIATEGKTPIQAVRNSANLNEYCIAGTASGRALNAHVPGDCVVCPS